MGSGSGLKTQVKQQVSLKSLAHSIQFARNAITKRIYNTKQLPGRKGKGKAWGEVRENWTLHPLTHLSPARPPARMQARNNEIFSGWGVPVRRLPQPPMSLMTD